MLKPQDVFTPRSANVNDSMYVPRPELEAALDRALNGQKNIIIYGQSGNGKSWLYKNLFKQQNVDYITINLANAARTGSLNSAIKSKVAELVGEQVEGREESVRVGGNAVIVTADGEQKTLYKNLTVDPLIEILNILRSRAGSRRAVIVFENFETILSKQSIVNELGNAIILSDDEDYAKFNVKFCIVGTPDNAQDFFASVENRESISNRLKEIPEVVGFPQNAAEALVRSGLFNKLKYKTDYEETAVTYTVATLTDCTPQSIHELCLAIAVAAEKFGKNIDSRSWGNGLSDWLMESLESDIVCIKNNMNSIQTKVGRRNQVLYSISRINLKEFSAQFAEENLRYYFLDSTRGKAIDVNNILSRLCEGSNPILKKVPYNKCYRFRRPSIKMCLRSILIKSNDGALKVFDPEAPGRRLDLLELLRSLKE